MEFVLKNFKTEIKVNRLANVHYFEFTPNFHTTDDSHDFCELVYVDKGKVEISSEHYTGELRQGSMIIHNSNQRHSLTCREDVAPNIIIIGFECGATALDRLTYAPTPLTEELQKMLAEIIKEGRSVYEPPYDIPYIKDMKKRRRFTFGADQLIKNYLQIFIIKSLRLLDSLAENKTQHESSPSHPSPLPQIGEIKKYLDDNFKEKINIEELCFLFNTNKTTLSKEFKRLFGHTVIDYVNCRRIDYTKKLLREGSSSLTEIANALNMSSVHYLTALFKKQEKITPTEYMRSVKKDFE